MLQNAIVLLKLLLLVGIVAFAATKIYDLTSSEAQALASQPTGFALASAFAGSLVWISLSYSGFNAAVYLAGEVDDMKRVVPRSMLVATLAVTVFYVLLNAIFVYANPKDVIAGQPDVAAITARSLGGPVFEAFVRWTIVACLLTSVFSMMMAAPRVYAKMAEDGFLPRSLRFEHDQRNRSSHGHVTTSRLGDAAGFGDRPARPAGLLGADSFALCRVLGRMFVFALVKERASVASDGFDSSILSFWNAGFRHHADDFQALAIAGNRGYLFRGCGCVSSDYPTIEMISNALVEANQAIIAVRIRKATTNVATVMRMNHARLEVI